MLHIYICSKPIYIYIYIHARFYAGVDSSFILEPARLYFGADLNYILASQFYCGFDPDFIVASIPVFILLDPGVIISGKPPSTANLNVF